MDGALRLAGRLLDAVITVFAVVAVAVLVALAACVSLEVVMRYLVGMPTRWVNEFSEYALLWLAFLAGAWILREEAHVKVEMLTDALSLAWQRRLHMITSVLGAVICGLFCWVSAGYVWEVYQSGEVLFKSVLVQKWAVMAVMPPGLALLTFQFVRRAFRDLPGPQSIGL
jgi:TRAP-type C4-dicarboxylate transport system permease small subunit